MGKQEKINSYSKESFIEKIDCLRNNLLDDNPWNMIKMINDNRRYKSLKILELMIDLAEEQFLIGNKRKAYLIYAKILMLNSVISNLKCLNKHGSKI